MDLKEFGYRVVDINTVVCGFDPSYKLTFTSAFEARNFVISQNKKEYAKIRKAAYDSIMPSGDQLDSILKELKALSDIGLISLNPSLQEIIQKHQEIKAFWPKQ